MPGHTIGRARFLIGGDMNTAPFSLSQILRTCRENHVLHTQAQVIDPTFGKPGDVCFQGGIAATCLTTTAKNHDPRHNPYGICWVMRQPNASGYATEQPLPPLPARSQAKAKSATPQRAASSSQAWSTLGKAWVKPQTNASGYATEQPLPAPPMPAPPTTAPMPAPPMPARLELEDLQSRAEQGVICESDIEQELEGLHAKHGNILQPEDFEEAPDEETAAAATEHSEEATGPQTEFATQERPADQNMVYAIVNEFLGQITLNNPEAEQLLLTALEGESCLTPSMQQRIEEVFSPIFFNYPNGLKDRSVWEPRDAGKYIRQWHELAAWRAFVETDDDAESTAATEHGKHLSKDKVTQIFTFYLDHFKTSLRPEQVGRPWAYHKRCAESKLNRDSGSRFVAYAIWEIGLPRLPSFATEQRDKQLSKQALEAVPGAIHNVLKWLDLLATALKQHRTTPEYQTALRKSGVTHGQSGLTATEHETRTATRKAKSDLQNAKKLAMQWDNRTLTFQNWKPWQEKLLDAYWDGSLQRRLEEVTRLGNADPMCRTPSVLSTR